MPHRQAEKTPDTLTFNFVAWYAGNGSLHSFTSCSCCLAPSSPHEMWPFELRWLWSHKNLLYLEVNSVRPSFSYIEEFQDCLRKLSQCAKRLLKHLFKRFPSNVWELGSSIPLLHSGSELSTCCCYSFDFRWRYSAQTCFVLIATWCLSECLRTLTFFYTLWVGMS